MFIWRKKMVTGSPACGVARKRTGRSRTGKITTGALLMLATLAAAGTLLAQQQPPPVDQGAQNQGQTAPSTAPSAAAPAAGSGSEENLLDFRGPGVPDLGIGDIGAQGGERNSIRLHGGASFVYDDNLVPRVQANESSASEGAELSWGAYGTHQSKRYTLGLNYQGFYDTYASALASNGSSQSLQLGVTVRATRRIVLDFRETGGTYRYGNSLAATSLAGDTTQPTAPNTSLVNQRVYTVASAGYLTYILTPRTTLTVGAQGFFHEITAPSPSKGYGYTLTGSLQHRLSRLTTIGVDYSFADYQFPTSLSDSTTNSVRATYARGFGRRWTISVQAGASRTLTNSVLVLPLDPLLAQLLGFSSIPIPLRDTTYLPDGTVELRRSFARSSLRLSYSTGISSDLSFNGTSRSENGIGAYNYSASRRVSLNLGGGYYSAKVIGGSLNYHQYTGNAGASYLITRGLYFSGTYLLRNQAVQIAGYKNHDNRVAIGLSYSPGKLPFSPF